MQGTIKQRTSAWSNARSGLDQPANFKATDRRLLAIGDKENFPGAKPTYWRRRRLTPPLMTSFWIVLARDLEEDFRTGKSTWSPLRLGRGT